MAVQGKQEIVGISAGADLTGDQYKAIAVGGTIAASSQATIGILQNKPENGADAALAWFGRIKAYAGAAITVGDDLSVTTSGFLITLGINANSGTGIVDVAVGKALVAANSGDLFDFIGNFANASNVASL